MQTMYGKESLSEVAEAVVDMLNNGITIAEILK